MKKIITFIALLLIFSGSTVQAADDIICPTNNQKPTEILIYFHGLLTHAGHGRAESLDSFKQQLSQIRKTRPGVVGVHVNGPEKGWGGVSVSISDIVKKAQTACKDSGNWPITLAGHSAGGQAVRDRLGSAGRAIFLDAVYWNPGALNDDCAKISLIDGESTYQHSDSLVKKCANQSGFHYIANKNSSLSHWAVRSKLSDFYLQTASTNTNDNAGNDVVTPGSSDQTPSVNTSLPTINNPFDKLQVQIPGMERFSEPIIKNEGEGMVIYNNWIAEYVIGVYNFGIGIIGVLAVVGLAIGGALWILAFGNPTLVAQGKSWITSSLLGLLLALGSYLILNSINSDFVNLQSLGLSYIKKEYLPNDEYEIDAEDQQYDGPSIDAPTAAGSKHGVPLLFQCSPEGRKQLYGRCNPPKTVCATGCGLISTLMVLNYYGVNPSLSEWTQVAVANGARVCGSGSRGTGLIAAAKQYGLNGKTISVSEIASYLDKNQPVIMSLRGPCVYTKRGHFVVLTGWRDRANNIADVNDPNNARGKEAKTWIKLGQWSGCSPNQIFTISR